MHINIVSRTAQKHRRDREHHHKQQQTVLAHTTEPASVYFYLKDRKLVSRRLTILIIGLKARKRPKVSTVKATTNHIVDIAGIENLFFICDITTPMTLPLIQMLPPMLGDILSCCCGIIVGNRSHYILWYVRRGATI